MCGFRLEGYSQMRFGYLQITRWWAARTQGWHDLVLGLAVLIIMLWFIAAMSAKRYGLNHAPTIPNPALKAED